MNRLLPSNNWASTASVSPPVTSGSAARPTVERARLADPAASPESHMNSRRDTGLGACMTYLLREQQSGSIGLGAELFFFGTSGRIRQGPRKIDFPGLELKRLDIERRQDSNEYELRSRNPSHDGSGRIALFRSQSGRRLVHGNQNKSIV